MLLCALFCLSILAFRLMQTSQGSPPAALAERPYIWRMQQPEQQRRYQLFPKERQLPMPNNKIVDADKALAMATPSNADKSEKPSAIAGLKIRINQHNMVRRRKVSVPDAGPMTTVHEVPMDSRMFYIISNTSRRRLTGR